MSVTKDPLKTLRALAKTDYYQSLYSCAKDLSLQIFENKTDLTKLQLWFLSYMSMYSAITMDIALGECPETVLKNTIYEDAYMLWKRKSTSSDGKKRVNQMRLPKQRQESGKTVTPKSSWVFKRNNSK